MARRWLHSLDVEVDDQRQALAEKALVALGQAIVDGRVKVDASGITIEADIIDLDIEGLILGIGGAGGGTLDGIIAALSSPAQAGEAADAEGDLETFLAALGPATEATLSSVDGYVFDITQVLAGGPPFYSEDHTGIGDILKSVESETSNVGDALWYGGNVPAVEYLYGLEGYAGSSDTHLGYIESSALNTEIAVDSICSDVSTYMPELDHLDDIWISLGNSSSDGGLWHYDPYNSWRSAAAILYEIESALGSPAQMGEAASAEENLETFLEGALGDSYGDGGLWYSGESAASLIYSTEQDLHDIYSALGGTSSSSTLGDLYGELLSIESDVEDVASSVDDVYYALGTPAQEDGGVLDDIESNTDALEYILDSLGDASTAGGLWYDYGGGIVSAAYLLDSIDCELEDVRDSLGDPGTEGGLWHFEDGDPGTYESAADILADIREDIEGINDAVMDVWDQTSHKLRVDTGA